MTGFPGSYRAGDVTFLMRPVTVATVDVVEKEALIQSGKRHYSRMLSREEAPPADYLSLFYKAMAANRGRFGQDIARLAAALDRRAGPGEQIVLVSLARAGTPAGVLLRRALARTGRQVYHYSVSIVRDFGIDLAAMAWILGRHPPGAIVLVDGWTGKGTIARELRRSIGRDLPRLAPAPLCVVSDLAGQADIAAGAEDYLIPPAILNGIISGLTSRSVLPDRPLASGEFHGCMRLAHLADADISRWYVDEQMKDVPRCLAAVSPARWTGPDRQRAAAVSRQHLERVAARYGVADTGRIKPGIGESTRAVLRRLPERLIVRDPGAAGVRHLVMLAQARKLRVETDPELACHATVVIRPVGRDPA